MSKKLFVYLHGNTFDKDNNKEELAKILKEFPEYEYYSFTGLYPYKGDTTGKKCSWFKKDYSTGQYIEDESYFESINYIKESIDAKLQELNLTWKDLILCGRSQGSFAAIVTALQNEENCHCLLTMGSLYVNHIKSFEINSNPKFYWIEMEDENILDDKRINGYKTLQQKGVKLEWLLGKDSDHDYISDTTIKIIIDKLKGLENE